MERMLEEEHEMNTLITRLASRIGISRDKAIILLILSRWYEPMYNQEFMLSEDYISLSRQFVDDPRFDYAETNCEVCHSYRKCQNIGCMHYFCRNCFEGLIESQVLKGGLLIFCPFYACDKFVSHDYIYKKISQEAKMRYKLALKNTYQQKYSAFKEIASITNTVVERGRGLGAAVWDAIWERKKDIFLMALIITWNKFHKP